MSWNGKRAGSSVGNDGQDIVRNKRPVKGKEVALYVFLSIIFLAYIAPLLWIFMVSLKTKSDVVSHPFALPDAFHWENYSEAWSMAHLGSGTLNSVIICGISLLVSMLIGAMAAFAIARLKWKLANSAMVVFLVGMMIPIHCIVIPLFRMYSSLYTSSLHLRLSNTHLGLILPYTSFALPMTIFILVGFFRSMPKEMFEAACIDGSSIYGCFFRIGLPLAKTGLFVTGLMTFVANWNELLLALIFTSTPEKRTLPVALTSFVGPHSTDYVRMFAALVIAIVPTIVVYSAFSNQIVDGLTTGAVKG